MSPAPIDFDLDLGYGVSRGSVRLRETIAKIHSSEDVTLTAEDVIITPGSIQANVQVLLNIVVSGDHAIVQYPTYGQLYLLPQHAGVDVSLWRMKEEDGWSLDVGELRKLVKPNTKAIILK